MIAACTSEGTAPPLAPPAPPTELAPLERCLVEGGTLRALWATSNHRGAVTSLAVGGTTVVLGAADGSVKTWAVDGTSPAYGAPLEDDTGIVVDGLAFGPEGDVLGVARDGRLSEWRLADAGATRATRIGDGPVAAVAASPDGTHAAVAVGLDTSELRIVTRATGQVSAPLPTTLWGGAAVAFAGDHLLTAGHWYGVPMVERRAAAAPAEVTDAWLDMALAGNVRALAIDPAATRLVAAGDGFVAVLAPDDLAGAATIVRPVPDLTMVGAVILGRDLFATVGAEGTLHAWTWAVTPITSLGIAPAVGIGIDAAGETLFTSGPDGDLHAFGCR